MGLAQILSRRPITEVDYLARQVQINLFGRRSSTGSVVTRTIPANTTFVFMNMCISYSVTATDTVFDVIVEFNGVRILDIRTNLINNNPRSSDIIDVKGLSVDGDGVADLEVRLANKSGSADVTVNIWGYERAT